MHAMRRGLQSGSPAPCMHMCSTELFYHRNQRSKRYSFNFELILTDGGLGQVGTKICPKKKVLEDFY